MNEHLLRQAFIAGFLTDQKPWDWSIEDMVAEANIKFDDWMNGRPDGNGAWEEWQAVSGRQEKANDD